LKLSVISFSLTMILQFMDTLELARPYSLQKDYIGGHKCGRTLPNT
jgi:hypothetical protein